MAENLFHCENCGTALSGDGVCPQCDKEFENSLSLPNPLVGKYQCPQCQSSFDEALAGAYPPNVPWYHPQDPQAQCPHCKTFLIDKQAVRYYSLLEYVGFMVVFSAMQNLPWRPWPQIGLTLCALAFVLIRKDRKSSKVNTEERYTLMPPKP